MKRIAISLLLILMLPFGVQAQATTRGFTVYKEFQPATIHLASGRQLKVSLANIFLRNSGLLYINGNYTKQANINTILQVDFKDRTYYRADSLLAYRVDSLGADGLYCAQLIDIDAWNQMVRNNVELTSLDLGDMIGYSTVEMTNEQDLRLPVVKKYIFLLKGKFVLAQDRFLKRVLTKEKRRVVEAEAARKDFSWTDERCLMELLKKLR